MPAEQTEWSVWTTVLDWRGKMKFSLFSRQCYGCSLVKWMLTNLLHYHQFNPFSNSDVENWLLKILEQQKSCKIWHVVTIIGQIIMSSVSSWNKIILTWKPWVVSIIYTESEKRNQIVYFKCLSHNDAVAPNAVICITTY